MECWITARDGPKQGLGGHVSRMQHNNAAIYRDDRDARPMDRSEWIARAKGGTSLLRPQLGFQIGSQVDSGDSDNREDPQPTAPDNEMPKFV